MKHNVVTIPDKKGKVQEENKTCMNKKRKRINCKQPKAKRKKVMFSAILPTLNDVFWSTKNELEPEKYTSHSRERALFICAKGHEWSALIHNITNGSKCPTCYQINITWTLEKMFRLTISDDNVDSECKIWIGTAKQLMYKGKLYFPHQLALFLKTGKRVQNGQHTRHMCGIKECVNPDHLKIGTARENELDKNIHGTQLSGERNPRSTLSDIERQEIINSPETNMEIAARLNVSYHTIKKLRYVAKQNPQEYRNKIYIQKQKLKKQPLTKEDMQNACERIFKKTIEQPCEPNDDDVNLTTSCKVWQGFVQKGYGRISVKSRNVFTHRFIARVYLNNGEKIPIDKVIRHLCKEKKCCNPEHLTIGTHAENTIDAVRAGKKGTMEKELVVEIYMNRDSLSIKERAKKYKKSENIIRRIDKRETYIYYTQDLVPNGAS